MIDRLAAELGMTTDQFIAAVFRASGGRQTFSIDVVAEVFEHENWETSVIETRATGHQVLLAAGPRSAFDQRLRLVVPKSEPPASHEEEFKTDKLGIFAQAIGLARLALKENRPAAALEYLDKACAESDAKHRKALLADGYPPELIDQFLGPQEIQT